MAEGINIKTLPAATTVADSDRLLIDKNVIGTQVIPFSAVIVNENQVTFYTDFVNLSAYVDALSASTSVNFDEIRNDIVSVSTNSVANSANIIELRTDINSVSSDVINVSTDVFTLSSNTTTFISGGISPSGSIIPEKVGILYFAADTKDYFVSVDNISDQDWRRILTVDY